MTKEQNIECSFDRTESLMIISIKNASYKSAVFEFYCQDIYNFDVSKPTDDDSLKWQYTFQTEKPFFIKITLGEKK